MPKSLTKVVYKPDTQSTDQFIIIVNPAEYHRWKAGETTIPLTDVVDSFQVFFSNQGSQGILGQASRQQLEHVFDTSKDLDVVQLILQKGKPEAADAISSGGSAMNVGIGSFTVDTRGKSLSGVP
ncbi:SDO1-like protein [Sparassis crispa]|uniref:SDO1-like protein n=1 Tax=Sparassis crispa TaxID=139825 RepID=A0A401GCL6_9APHY|nr:SDO1-like protein [Sparassis crispa]GBE79897.1 SDO1-like protein [Sparassis crispa]